MADIRTIRTNFEAGASGLLGTISKITKANQSIGDSMQKSVAKANREFDGLESAAKNLEKVLEDAGNPKGFEDLQKATKKAQDELKETGSVGTKSLSELRSAVASSEKSLVDMGDKTGTAMQGVKSEVSKIDTELLALSKSKALGSLTREAGDLTQSFNKVKGETSQLEEALKQAGQGDQFNALESAIIRTQGELADTGRIGKASFSDLQTEIDKSKVALSQMDDGADFAKLTTSLEGVEGDLRKFGSVDYFAPLERSIEQAQAELRTGWDAGGQEIGKLEGVLDSVQKELQDTGRVSRESFQQLQDASGKAKSELGTLDGPARDAMNSITRAISGVEGDLRSLGTNTGILEINTDAERAGTGLKNLGGDADRVNTQLKGLGGENSFHSLGEDGEREVRKVESIVDKLKNSIKNLGKENGFNAMADDADNAADSMGGVNTEAAGMGGVVPIVGNLSKKTMLLGGAAVAAGAGMIGAVKSADDFKGASNDLASAMGLTNNETKEYESVMKGVYNNNFGEGFADIAAQIATVATATNLTGEELQKATEDAILLRDSFGWDVNETTRAARVMMTEFGYSARDAMEILAQGQQTMGSSVDDTLDTMWEYSGAFEDLGFNGEQAMNMLVSSVEAGARNTDVAADSVNEFATRIRDGSDTTREGLQMAGLDADAITEKFEKGGKHGVEAFQQVTDALGGMGNKAEQEQAAVALFGTLAEDVGVEAVLALGNMNGEIDKSKDALGAMNDVKYDTIGEALAGIGRNVHTGVLMPIQEQMMPGINKAIGAASRGFENLKWIIGGLFSDDTNKQNNASVVLDRLGLSSSQIEAVKRNADLLQNAIQRMRDGIAYSFDQIKSNGKKLWEIVSPSIMAGLKSGFDFLLGLVKQVADFWQQNGPQILQAAKNVFTGIAAVVKFTMPAIQAIVSMVFSAIKNIFQGGLNVILGLVKFFSSVFTGDWKGAFDGIVQIIKGAIQLIWGLINLSFFGRILNVARLAFVSLRMIFVNAWAAIRSLFSGNISGLVAAWRSMLNWFRNLGQTLFGGLIAMFRGIWNGIAALFRGSISLVSNIFRGGFTGAINFVRNIFSGLRTFFSVLWSGLRTLFTGAINGIVTVTRAIFTGYINGLRTVFNGLRSFFSGLWSGIRTIFSTVINGTVTAARLLFSNFISNIRSIFSILRSFFTGIWNGVRSVFTSVIRNIVNTGRSLFNSLSSSIRSILTTLRNFFASLWTAIRSRTVETIRVLQRNAISIIRSLYNGLRNILISVRNFFERTWNLIRTTTVNIVRRLWDAIKSIFTTLYNTTRSIFRNVYDFFKSIWNSIRDFIRNSARRIWENLRSTWNTIKDRTVQIFTDIYNTLRNRFNDMVDMARNLPRRMAEGIKATAGRVATQIKNMTNSMLRTLGRGVNGVIGGVNWILEKLSSDKKISKWDVPQYAQGTGGGKKAHPGGPAWVGDGKGSNAGPELIKTPDGNTGLSPSKATLMNLPKGTLVASATQTRAITEAPRYAEGNLLERGADMAKSAAGSAKNALNYVGKATSENFTKGADKVKDVVSTAGRYIGEGASYLKDKGEKMWDWAMDGAGGLLDKVLSTMKIKKPDEGTGMGKIAGAGFDFAKEKAVGLINQFLPDMTGGGSQFGWGSPYRMTSPFGPRFHPVLKRNRMHNGWDQAAPSGTKIPAQQDGRVTFSGTSGGYGNLIRIMSGGAEHYYGHNSRNSVQVGDMVKAGETIGSVGSTGLSTGPHVHHGIKSGGKWVDPAKFGGGGSAAGPAGPGVQKWRSYIMRAAAQMGQKVSSSEVAGILAQIQRESGGNQSIVQSSAVRDINTRNGNPARGLLQYIPQTFNAYKVRGHSNINSGFDQLLAFFNNKTWRRDLPYGRRGWGPRGGRVQGYAMGGEITHEHMAMVGEGGKAETVVPTEDRSLRSRAKALWMNAGAKMDVFTKDGQEKINAHLKNIYNGMETVVFHLIEISNGVRNYMKPVPGYLKTIAEKAANAADSATEGAVTEKVEAAAKVTPAAPKTATVKKTAEPVKKSTPVKKKTISATQKRKNELNATITRLSKKSAAAKRYFAYAKKTGDWMNDDSMDIRNKAVRRAALMAGYQLVKSSGKSVGKYGDKHYSAIKAGTFPAIKGYKDGGFINSPTLAMLAEGGWAETVLSQDPAKKARTHRLWKDHGEMAGYKEVDSAGAELGEVVALLNDIKKGVNAQRIVQAIFDTRRSAKDIEPVITEIQKRKGRK